MNIVQKDMALGANTFSFQAGKFAHQADGAVLVTNGDQSILVTAQMGGAREGMNFFPLVVEFEPRYYSAGRLKHSKVNKREGRKSDPDILTCRVTDRPLRPMFPKGMRNEVQIIGTQFQTDGDHASAPLLITGASLAIHMAGIPFEKLVSAVQVGMDAQGNFITNPSYTEIEETGLDFVVAGTEDAIMMVEAGANLISNEKALEALEYAHGEIKKLCKLQTEFLAEMDTPEIKEVKLASESESFEVAAQLVDQHITEDEFATIAGVTKKDVKKKMQALEEKLFDACATQLEAEEISKGDLVTAFEKRFAKNMRARVFSTGKRVDGRDVDTVRSLYVETGLFPRVHGSGLFQRGETQALTMLTLGGPDDEKYVDTTDRGERRSRYIHHYNFPPYSVGETRMLRGPGRREIGHGALAERALNYVMPTEEDGWQYMVRCVSEILTCNGSSSMASVCGSTLALMDAGVPIKTPIAGIAMGLLMQDDGDYRILTDIQGLEDFDGDMDFKVTGDETGITALQLDIKIKGLDLSLLKEALEKATIARAHILEAMKKEIATPRKEMNEHAPLIETMNIDPDQIRDIIGKGGAVIQGMCADYDVKISVEDDGTVIIAGLRDGIAQARTQIEQITYMPQPGDEFMDCEVKTIVDFGAFVQYAPGKDGLVHVSQIAEERVEKVEDYLKVGQKVNIKIVEIDRQGRVKLTMKGMN